MTLSEHLKQVEQGIILKTLASNYGNRSATARELGISRTTLHLKLKEYSKNDDHSHNE